MNHYSREEISDFFYKELDKEKELELSKHLESCNECSEILKEFNSFSNLLSSLHPLEAPEISFEHLFEQEVPDNQNKSVLLIFSSIIVALFSLIYFLQTEIVQYLIPETIHSFFLFKTLDPFSQSIFIFFLFGSVISLSIAPILRKECESNLNLSEVI